jgi:hypothetical protein
MYIKKLSVYIVLILILLLIFDCSERERLNPLDPNNPYTNGSPQNVQIYSHKKEAVISWNPVEVNSLVKYNIYRSVQDSTGLMLYDSVQAGNTTYIDELPDYNLEYYYSIQAVTETDTSLRSEIVSTIPGEYNFLIADFHGHQILELSYDGKHVIKYFNDVSASGLVNMAGQIFAIDLWAENLQKIANYQLSIIAQIDEEPVEIEANPEKGVLYILCRDTNNLLSYSSEGNLINRINPGWNINFGTRAAYDSTNNYLWITNQDSNEIHYYDFNNESLELVSKDIESPNEIEIDKNGGCWIASAEGIIRINNLGEINKFLSDHYIYDISKNDLSGDIYYSGVVDETSRIGYLSFGGSDNNVIFDDKYNYITNIKCVPNLPQSGLLMINAWTGELLRINPEGKEIGNSIFVYSAEDIVLK